MTETSKRVGVFVGAGMLIAAQLYIESRASKGAISPAIQPARERLELRTDLLRLSRWPIPQLQQARLP